MKMTMTVYPRRDGSLSTHSSKSLTVGITFSLLCMLHQQFTIVSAFLSQRTNIAQVPRNPLSKSSEGRWQAKVLLDATSACPSNDSDNASHNKNGENDLTSFLSDRRRWIHQATATVAALGTSHLVSPTMQPALAGGLLQFPIGPSTQPLKNNYHFMRAGPSELEMDGIYSTNPLFLTNRENAMHPSGEQLILKALEKMKRETELFPTVAYHSLAANGMDTGDLIARELKLGREKLLPEFTYLDQRGVGIWDSGDETLVKPAVWALDYLEAGEKGMSGRPPPHNDGTPNETLNDQFIRLRQFLSLQESRYVPEMS